MKTKKKGDIIMSIVKLKIKNRIVYAENIKENLYIDVEGNVHRMDDENVSRTRNVPDAVKAGLKTLVSIEKKKEKEKEKFDAVRVKYNEITRELNLEKENAAKEIREALGVLTLPEFCVEFWKSVSYSAKSEMNAKGYKLESPLGVCYTDQNLYISRGVMVEKYFRKGSFVYEEYDGNVFMCDDAESNNEYKKILKDYSRPLGCMKTSCFESLSLGDKDSLWYTGYYAIKLPDVLTKQTAAELAKNNFKR